MSTDNIEPNDSLFLNKEPEISLPQVILLDEARRQIEKVIFENLNKEKLVPHALLPRRKILFHGPPGTGKAQPLYSTVLTPKGPLPLKSAKVGTKILTPFGKTSVITGIFPQGEKPIFELTTKDGRTVECCEDHLWNVFNSDWRQIKRAGKKIPRDTEAHSGWRTITTGEVKRLLKKHPSRKIYLPLPTVEFPEKTLPISPYWMGCLLGNGTFLHEYLRISTSDNGVIQRLTSILDPKLHLTHEKGGDWNIVLKKKGGKNPLIQKIKALGLWGKKAAKKFIPAPFLQGSRAQRLQLLEGLLDTDGTISKGCVSYSTSSPQLARDFQQLCWSLGYMCSKNSRTPSYTYKGKKRKGAKNYNLILRINNPSEIRLASKKSLRLPTHGQYVGKIRAEISKVKKTKRKTEMVCISIANPHQLYITDNYVVTHNTVGAEAIAYELKKSFHVFNLESLPSDSAAALRVVGAAFRTICNSDGVFLFDEFDAIATHRSSSKEGSESRRVVNAILINLETFTGPSIVVAATNFIESIDGAFRRRFDTICQFALPTPEEREETFRRILAVYNFVAQPVEMAAAVQATEFLSFGEVEEMAIQAAKTAILHEKEVSLIAEIKSATDRKFTFRKTIHGVEP